MELLDELDLKCIMKNIPYDSIVNWKIENYSNELLGYLGEHLRLRVRVSKNGVTKEFRFFVKTMPLADPWKHEFLKESQFFKKEYVMLSDLFPKLGNNEGENKWRPTDLLLKENLYVFEDVVEQGYQMPDQLKFMSHEEIMTIVELLAKFAAKSYIYEEKKSKKLRREYRISDDYACYLQEPANSQDWRMAGKRAVIYFLKLFSKYKNMPNFNNKVESVITDLFQQALVLMNRGSKYRNTVCHRDLWTNNILFKRLDNGKLHGLIVDFQTVIYSNPLIDISSILYFNTTKQFRNENLQRILNTYYNILSQKLNDHGIDISTVLKKENLMDVYEESVVFGIVQAAILVPIVAMKREYRMKYFNDPETCARVNNVCRNEVLLEVANESEQYKTRVMEIFDEIVEKYIYSDSN